MYSGTQHTHQLESLKQFLASNEPLMLVIAEESRDKAHLISELIADIQIKQRVIRLQSNENLLPIKLMQLLSQHCGVELNDTALIYEHQLDKIIQSLATQNLATVFIIDDAERLPTETLTALLHISVKQNIYHTHLHILLAGKAKLIEKVQLLQKKPVPQLLLKPLLQRKQSPAKQQHWVKGISLSLLLVIGLVMWYHKEHNRFPFMHSSFLHDKPLGAVAMTGDIRFVSTEKEPKTIATVPSKPSFKAKTKKKLVLAKPTPKPAYTLQLMGGRHLNALEHFVAKNNLIKTTHIIMTAYQGKPWYIITYGKYQTTSQAKMARQKLPSSLQKLHPWVRPTSTLH